MDWCERPIEGFALSFFAGLIMVFLGLSSSSRGLVYGSLPVLFGVLMIAGGLIALLGLPTLGGFIITTSSSLSILFPYYPHLFYVTFPILGIIGGILTLINRLWKKLGEARLSLAALFCSAIFSFMFLTYIFRIDAWGKAPLSFLAFVYGALCLAFAVSLIIGLKLKTLWWIPSSFIVSGIIGVVLNSIGIYINTLWEPINHYGCDWDSALATLAVMFFVLLMGFASALIGVTAGALGVTIGKFWKAKPLKLTEVEYHNT